MASNDYANALESLASADVWKRVGMTAAGFVGPLVVNDLAETAMELPDEAFGVAGMVAGKTMVDNRYAVAGSGLYTTDALARRFGVRDVILGLGGGA